MTRVYEQGGDHVGPCTENDGEFGCAHMDGKNHLGRCTHEVVEDSGVFNTVTAEEECKRWCRVIIRRIESAELSMDAARIAEDANQEAVLWAICLELRTMLHELGVEEVAAQCTIE